MARLSPDTPILVIDDSLAIRARVEAYLKRLGFTNIRTAGTVKEALETFAEQRSEIVFLDLVIDEERGADFAAEALSTRPFVHIVLMTALPPSHEHVTVAIAEGARDFVPKPVQFNAIVQVLDRIAESRLTERVSPGEDASYV